MKSLITTLVIIVLIVAGIYWLRNPVEKVVQNPITATSSTAFTLTSSAFSNGEVIPNEYTCDGININPPLSFNNPPEGTESFALTMYDPDVPKEARPEGFFDHWALYDIPASTTGIMASSSVGVQGNNGSGKTGYTGPCPPKEYEPTEHRYIFTLYAMDGELNLPMGATRDQIENATTTRVLGKTELMGRYERP